MIKVNQISKELLGNKILKDITMEFKCGNIYSIVGPNGAGKTTLISILSNLMVPDSGNIIHSKNDKNIFLLLSGERNLYYKNTVKDNIKYFGTLRGCTKKTIDNNIKSFSEKFPDIKNILNKKVENLSFGQKRIVATYISLVSGSDCVILDEVSEGLDLETKVRIRNMLSEAKTSKIIILISHDFEFIEKCTDYVYYIKNGILVFETDNVKDIRQDYKNLNLISNRSV
ncbi:ATP-binding cassette domain-containing protein [Paramaledivibacter caminithermalis]|jgi:ABC-type multidrug transport system ATPase subunit|uniref:ABC-2 type transport system ATP-binding protein n=1 Tax=Paramaledivibacter caminithermalis (strain DSM 15212 / CIP 107654 / DViRD3) TaxID=1121301 RepID=A0A1M6RXR2_PARC5|nr:ABC transporter ATP-binding protein [Paramaledivibacter caminithermalis]SHK37231.1 ABC-2 type transport system ATP-binding protein [Paramaledivibacter caminithermalis DSM 15212]